MAKRVIKLTESDIKKIVKKVIEEQYPGMYGYYAGMQTASSAPSERIINISNIKRTVDSQGIIRNPNSQFNNTRWVDYITQNQLTDDELAKADELIKQAKAKQTETNARLQNIINIYNSVDAQGIIRNPKSGFDGKSWSSYIKDFGVTQSEVNQAKQYKASNITNTITNAVQTSLANAAQTVQNTARMQNIVNTLKSVDASGIIKNPASGSNNMKWTDYVATYKITPEEIAQAKQQIGGSTQQPARTQRQSDPEVVKIQQDLKAKGYNLGTTGPNKDGVDGVMGPKTRAAVEAEKAKASGTTAQTATTPDNLGINSPDFATRLAADYARRNPYKTTDLRSTLSPELQKTYDEIMARNQQTPPAQ